MSNTLTAVLLDRLSLARAFDFAESAILLCSIDEGGQPHPAMVSSLELVARDAESIRFTIGETSRSSRNLAANRQLTLVIADDVGVFYIKGEAARIGNRPISARGLSAFHMRVTAVLEDTPTASEHAHIVSGIRVHRAHLDESSTRALLMELLTLP